METKQKLKFHAIYTAMVTINVWVQDGSTFLILAFRGQRQVDRQDFEPSLLYTVSSRPVKG